MPEELKVRIMVVSGTVLQSTLLDSPQGSSLDTETAACLQWCPKERDGSRTDSDGVLVDGGHCSLPDLQGLRRSSEGCLPACLFLFLILHLILRTLRKGRERLERWLSWQGTCCASMGSQDRTPQMHVRGWTWWQAVVIPAVGR